jgi:hypothetical protein
MGASTTTTALSIRGAVFSLSDVTYSLTCLQHTAMRVSSVEQDRHRPRAGGAAWHQPPPLHPGLCRARDAFRGRLQRAPGPLPRVVTAATRRRKWRWWWCGNGFVLRQVLSQISTIYQDRLGTNIGVGTVEKGVAAAGGGGGVAWGVPDYCELF